MRVNQVYSHGKKHDSSRISRSPQRLKNIKRQKGKYPLLAEKIVQMSDIILEILDSRFIKETRNSEIEDMIKRENKKIIYVFNKSDLIDLEKIDRGYIEKLNPKVFVSCTKRGGIKELRDRIKILAGKVKEHVDKRANKITVGVVGYPNTGKSSVINLLSGKNATRTGSEAGFTKGIIKVKLTSDILLVDSPGIIPNKEYSSSNNLVMSQHTKLGARAYNQVKEPEVAVAEIMKEFPSIIENFYDIDSDGDSEVLIENLGRQRKFLIKGNKVDEDRTARLILKDWQEGKIKRI
ncbi:GTPase Der [uncultured archaeon]|nr:GTPase Der [uncultured archaeon]